MGHKENHLHFLVPTSPHTHTQLPVLGSDDLSMITVRIKISTTLLALNIHSFHNCSLTWLRPQWNILGIKKQTQIGKALEFSANVSTDVWRRTIYTKQCKKKSRLEFKHSNCKNVLNSRNNPQCEMTDNQ